MIDPVHASSESDDALLLRMAGGTDEGAFAELVERYRTLVGAACRRVLGDAVGAEDAAQMTWLVLLRRAQHAPRDARFAGWLHRTISKDAARTRSPRPWGLLRAPSLPGCTADAPVCVGGCAGWTR